jgi:hypothetical protein
VLVSRKKLVRVLALILAVTTFFLYAELAVITNHDCHGEICTVCELLSQIRKLLVELGVTVLVFCGLATIKPVLSYILLLAQRPITAF